MSHADKLRRLSHGGALKNVNPIDAFENELLEENDDEQEKAERRKSKFPTNLDSEKASTLNKRKSIAPKKLDAATTENMKRHMTGDQLASLYSNCIQLSTANVCFLKTTKPSENHTKEHVVVEFNRKFRGGHRAPERRRG
jgi:hypothetical protein